MYLRPVHAESHVPTLRQFIQKFPLGILTTAITSDKYPTIQSSHIPFVLDVKDSNDEQELGVLRAHMARANPQTKALIEEAKANGGKIESEVLILFNDPHHSYVTPKFYKETKPDTGKVVPTWNYAAVQAYGKITVYPDVNEQSVEFLKNQISDLSQYSETKIMGYEKPWSTSDAPEKYIDIMMKGIMGVSIEIDRLEGKFKMSQELKQGDRDGVIDGFSQRGDATSVYLSNLVSEREKIQAEKANKG